MAKASNAGNILLALQIATLVAEAQSGDDAAQLEVVSEVLDILTLKVAYLRNNPAFAKALSDQIAAEVAKRTSKKADSGV